MVTIESKKVEVNCSAEECFKFLSDMNNYKQILPDDKITDWSSTETSCFFKIQNTYTLELLLKNSEPNKKIHIISGPGSPIKFDLDMVIEDNNKTCNAQLICEADINQFLKLIIEKPLYYLFNHMADKLVEVKE